jgi:hypothetical protein
VRVLVVAFVLLLTAAGRPAAAAPPGKTPAQTLAERMAKAWCGSKSGPLPPSALRGLEDRLPQYPTVSLATLDQRNAAERLLEESVAAARSWRTTASAAAAGFDLRQAQRRKGDTSVHYLHAEHRSWGTDPRLLDPHRPKALIYANIPGSGIVLVGLMFSMPRGVLGPNPGGPITRWHRHHVCARGEERGLKPNADGTCPPGSRAIEGSEMLHIWFTGDLRSAFAIHAPTPELCAAKLLPSNRCSR